MMKDVTYNATTGATSTTWRDSGYTFGYRDVFARSMILADDGGIVFTGPAYDATTGSRESYFYKTTFEGPYGWLKKFSISANDSTRCIRQAPDGSYVVTGWTYAGSGGSDVLLVGLGTKAPGEVAATVDVAGPVAAVIAGTGLGLLGIFAGRLNDLLASALNKAASSLKGWLPADSTLDFITGYLKTHAKALLFRKESRARGIKAVERVPFLAGFSSLELTVLLASGVLLGLAYLLAKHIDLLQPVIVLYIAVAGSAVVLHDMTHRYLAWRYKAVTEYKFWGLGTLAMFATALLFGTVYAIPARTVINNADRIGGKQQAIIFFAGPAVSFALAILFLLVTPLGGTFRTVGLLGFSMNLLSAAYSLMPFDPMDGNKLYRWKKLFWALIFLPLLAIYLLSAIYLY
jgi:hypothetical protein